MKYDVVWVGRSEELLADLWTRAAKRAALTAAANSIDDLLARSPWKVGEARLGTTRVLVEDPLIVLYDIIEDDRRVRVLDL
jgi:hypothetical protein